MFVRNKLVDNTAKCPPVGGKPVDWWAFVFVISAAVVRFGPVQRVLDENQEPNHGPVLQNSRTQNQTIENRSQWSGSVFFWSELEPNPKKFQ
jgi:hypothetical protein